MAQLLTINAATAEKKPGNAQRIGDIVLVAPDTHQFSPTEQNLFDIYLWQGFTVNELKFAGGALYPVQIDEAWKVRGKWYRGVYFGEDVDAQEEKDIWWDWATDAWYFLNSDPKFKYSVKNFTATHHSQMADSGVTRGVKDAIISNFLYDGVRDEVDNFTSIKLQG